jgi:hypothetical protein
VAILLAGVSHHAQGQTVTLANGNGFTYNGLTYTISGCAYTALSVVSTCAAANADLTATVASGGPAIEVLHHGSGALMSIAAGTTGFYSDISFLLDVTAPSSRTTVSSVTDLVSGTSASTDRARVTSSVTPTTNNNHLVQPTLSANLTTTSATEAFAAYNPTPAADLSLSIDLKVNAIAANTSGLNLNNATFRLSPAPEPASIALLVTAVTGLAAVRRRSGCRSLRRRK